MHYFVPYLWNLRDANIDNYKNCEFDHLLLNDMNVLKKENHTLILASHEPWELCESQKISLAIFKEALIF